MLEPVQWLENFLKPGITAVGASAIEQKWQWGAVRPAWRDAQAGKPAEIVKRGEDWRGASGKCSKSWVLEKITFCDRKTSSVFLQRLFITGFSSTCQITRSEGNRLKISYRSDESWCSWKKTNSRHRDPQLPRAEGAWEKEKRELLVKNSPASMGCELGKVVLPGWWVQCWHSEVKSYLETVLCGA